MQTADRSWTILAQILQTLSQGKKPLYIDPTWLHRWQESSRRPRRWRTDDVKDRTKESIVECIRMAQDSTGVINSGCRSSVVMLTKRRRDRKISTDHLHLVTKYNKVPFCNCCSRHNLQSVLCNLLHFNSHPMMWMMKPLAAHWSYTCRVGAIARKSSVKDSWPVLVNWQYPALLALGLNQQVASSVSPVIHLMGRDVKWLHFAIQV